MKKNNKHDPRIDAQTPGEQVDHYNTPTEAAVEQETISLNSLGAQENQAAGPRTILKQSYCHDVSLRFHIF